MVWSIPSFSHSFFESMVFSSFWQFSHHFPTLPNIKSPILQHADIHNSQYIDSTLVLIVRFLLHKSYIQISNHQLNLLILNPVRLSWNLWHIKVLSIFFLVIWTIHYWTMQKIQKITSLPFDTISALAEADTLSLANHGFF